MKRTSFLSIRTKIIILLVSFITVPFLITGLLTYIKFKSSSEQSISDYAQQIVTQTSLNLDRYIKEIERLTFTPQYDPSVMRILTSHRGFTRNNEFLATEDQNKMNLFISSLNFDRSEIRGISIFTNDGIIFSNSDTTMKRNWEEDELGWMKIVANEDGGLAVLPPHEVDYYLSGKQMVVSLSRQIREVFTFHQLGFIKIDLHLAGMERILTPVNYGEHSKLYVTDKNGRLLYPFHETTSLSSDLSKFKRVSRQSEYSGLTVEIQLPLHELRQNAITTTQYTLLISLVTLAFAYVLAILASNRLIKPLLHLRSKMKLVQNGSLNVRATVRTHDEIGYVTDSFNQMVNEIERLVKEVYEVNLRQREAELAALQSQMNPHFLYNTLESISMIAIAGDQIYLSDAVTNLGKLLRYSVDNEQIKVKLNQELQFAAAYLAVQRMRLGEELIVDFDIDSELEEALVPKLIIQPFIENAIEHGKGSDTLHVCVKAMSADGNLLIIVSDDGVGMDEQTINKVKAQMHAVQRSSQDLDFGSRAKGFALRNAQQRIQLLYGELYGIDMQSVKHGGVAFTITLPLEWGTAR